MKGTNSFPLITTVTSETCIIGLHLARLAQAEAYEEAPSPRRVLLHFTTRVFSVRFYYKCGPPGDDEKIRPDRRTRWRQNVALFRGVGLAIDKSAIYTAKREPRPTVLGVVLQTSLVAPFHGSRLTNDKPAIYTTKSDTCVTVLGVVLQCLLVALFREGGLATDKSTIYTAKRETTLHSTQGRAPDPSRSTLSRNTAGH